MRFRINLYLQFITFFKAFFLTEKKLQENIAKLIKRNSKKKYFFLTSQLRVSFMILLKYLIRKFPDKKNIIFIDYNLPEMPNVAKNLNLNVEFNEIDKTNWFFNFKKLERQVNNKTIAIVLTNMFNTMRDSVKLKNFCKKKNIILIEDNAIYFDNYSLVKKKKIFSGHFGHYSLYSFNIMKNISALYGGGISFNDKDFQLFFENYKKKLSKFPVLIFYKQIIIYILLKIFSYRYIYKYFFFHIVKITHLKKIQFLLKIFYPSLKFKIIKFPKYYFSEITSFSKKLIYLQLMNKKLRRDNFNKRLKNNRLYYRLLKKEKIQNLRFPKIIDSSFQNFIDFPIIIKNKKKFINHMLNNNFEVRSYYYKDCKKIFNHLKKTKKSVFEKNLVCLPNHVKIDELYIRKLIQIIASYK